MKRKSLKGTRETKLKARNYEVEGTLTNHSIFQLGQVSLTNQQSTPGFQNVLDSGEAQSVVISPNSGQGFFCTPDYITPVATAIANNFHKDSPPCPKSLEEDKTTTSKRQRLGFDLNVPVMSDERTYTIDLSSTQDNIDHYNVPLDQNDTVVDEVNSRVKYRTDLNGEEVHMDESHLNGEEYAEEKSQINQFDAAGYNHGKQVISKRKRLTDEQQDIVYGSLLRISINGKLKRSSTTQVANTFNLHIRQVQRIWRNKKGLPLGEVRKKLKCGRKRVHVDIDRIPQIPLSQRTTLNSLANALQVSYSTLFRRLKEGLIRRHSNAINHVYENKIS